MIEVHLYGKLRRHAINTRATSESVVRLEPQTEETARTALKRVGITPDDVCHLFLNGTILSSRNSLAPWLEYQRGPEEGWETVVRDGDRLGVFGHDMALLVM